MAGEQKYTVDIGVTGLNNLNKLQSNIDGLHQRMMSLKTVLAGGLFAGLGAGALRMADDLQDLANSTGIATARLLEFKKALVENGGAADTMAQGVTTFVRSIDEAAQGSLKAQNTFRDLGITMNDLKTLGEQQLMVKALKGIGGIADASRRAAIMMDLFGKSFRTVDAAGLAADLEKSAGSGDKYAAALRRGAELNDALATASGNVKLAFLEAFSPAIKALNEFNTATSEGTAKMNTLIAAIKIAGIALVASFSAGALLGIVTAIGQIGRGIGIIGGALGATGFAAWAASAFAAAGKLLVPLRAIAVLLSAGLGIYAASQLFDDFGSIALNVLSRIAEGLLEVAGSLLNLPTDAIAGFMNLFGAGIKDPKGLGTPFIMAKDALEGLRKKQEEAAAANKKLREETKKTGDAAADAGAKISRAIDTSAYDNAVKGIQKVSVGYQENGRRILENIQLETLSIGNTREANDLEAARTALANRAYDAVQQLRDAQASMSKELKDAGLGKVYEAEILKVEELSRKEGLRLTQLMDGLHTARLLDEDRKRTIENITKALDEQAKRAEALTSVKLDITAQKQDVEFAAAQTQRSPLQQQLATIQEDARKAALAAGRAFAAAFEDTGDGMTSERFRELSDGLELITKGYNDIANAQIDTLTQSRTFSEGWKTAFNEYAENATNAATQARDIFSTATKGMEDMLVNFAHTGKLEFKGFVSSIVDMILRSQIQQLLAKQFGGMGTPGGSGDLLGSLWSGFKSLLGFAAGGIIPNNGPVLVGERGPEILSGAGGRSVTPNGELGGSTMITYNINAVDASSFRSLVASDPEFLFAVTEQGRRRQPGQRR